MQRNLDEKFKSMSNHTHFFRVFFGSVEGTLKIFPGMDEECSKAAPYDPRIRHWYLQSTYVRKGVVVLVDSGHSMHKELNAGKEGETYSSKVKQTLLKFLDTMWVRDYIKILFFNGDNPNVRPLLNDSFVQVDFSDSDGKPPLNRLKNSISGKEFDAHRGRSDPKVADAIKAINHAIKLLTDKATIPTEYLKVTILLDGGGRITSLPETEIQNSDFSLAVLGPSNELLGVVALHIFNNKVEEQFGIEEVPFVDAANSKKRSHTQEFDDNEVATKVRFNHTGPCESFKDEKIEGEGVCKATLMNEDPSVFRKLSCCENCTFKVKVIDWPANKIAGVTVAGVAGAVGLVLLVSGCWYFIHVQNFWMIYLFKMNSSNEFPSNEENRSLAQTASHVDPQRVFQKES
nr:hypothetical protein PHYPA_022084 [Physcomitrium patens]